MTSADVTLRTLSLGANQDTITGWYAKSFADSTIKMIIQPKGSNLHFLSAGLYAKYDLTGFTQDVVHEGDEIKDANLSYYLITEISEVWWLDCFSHRACSLVKRYPHYDRPATYGTGATVEDPRHRTKDWFDTYDIPANLSKDDNSQATYITQFSGADYPIGKLFVDKTIDLVFTIGEPNSEPVLAYDKVPDSYKEVVPIEISVMDKTGITGTNLKWKAETELRRLAETYFLGSLRTLKSMRPKTQNYGSAVIYSYDYELNYLRGIT